MKIVVTGCAGFVGSHLAEELVSRGNKVFGIDSFHPYYSEKIKKDNLKQVEKASDCSDGDFVFVEGSITDERGLEKLPRTPDRVFHNAAIAGVRNSIENPSEYAKQNIFGTSRLIEYFESIGKFIFASSSSVYGMVEEHDLPVKENKELDPIAPYPQSKKHCEELIKLYSGLYDFDYVILRYFTAYGPRQRPDEAFTKFIQMILNDDPVTIYGDGEQSRDFTHVEDIVRGNILASEKGKDEIYNIGSDRRISVNKMVEVLDETVDKKVKSKYVDQPEGDVRHTLADVSKAKSNLGYEPEIEFEDGVESCVEWVRKMREKNLL